MTPFAVCAFVAVAIAVLPVHAATGNATSVFDWVSVEYDWPSPDAEQEARSNGRYQPVNNVITGLKVDRDDNVYVSVPRWRPGVPSTLNKVVVVDGKPLLSPYPSWEWNDERNPANIQYVQSMEIDTQNRMWILDVGRRNIFNFAPPVDVVNAAAKLIVYDIDTNTVVRNFTFSSAVAPFEGSFLNDLVLDEINGVVYISDTGTSGAIVVYDFETNSARRWGGDPSQQANTSYVFDINGKPYQTNTNQDPIGLHPNLETLYYGPLQSNHIHSVPTALLRNFSTTDAEIGAASKFLGLKPSGSDGMTFGANGHLFFGAFSLNGVMEWDVTQPLSSAKLLCSDDTNMQWQDTFAWDNSGNLWFTSNRLQNFLTHTMDHTGASGPNMRVFKVPVGTQSYLAGEKASALAAVAGEGAALGVDAHTGPLTGLSTLLRADFAAPAWSFENPCASATVSVPAAAFTVDVTTTQGAVDPATTRFAPTFSWPSINSTLYYHLAVFQPTAPNASTLAYLNVNMPGGVPSLGDELFSYMAPLPVDPSAALSVYALYATQGQIPTPNAVNDRAAPFLGRQAWSADAWRNAAGLGSPVGVAWHTSTVAPFTAWAYRNLQAASFVSAAGHAALAKSDPVAAVCTQLKA